MATPLVNPALQPPGLAGPTAPAAPASPAGGAAVSGPSFADVLARQTTGTQGLTFSRHALARLQQRGIDVQGPTLQRLNEGVARAASKGSRDSVVFLDGTAFVVSVANSTVITAVDSEHMQQHVFTNIDSAVIA